jgi:intracellular septation protein A
MAIQKIEIIISATIGSSLFFLFILDTAHIVTNYIGTTIFNTLIYLAICYLHSNRISSLKWRVSFVVVSLGLLVLIISNHFYVSPWKWDFVSRLIFGIDVVTIVAFLLGTFTHDQRSIILFTIFATVTVLISLNLSNSESFNKTFTAILSIIVYIGLSIFHVKQTYDRWKIAAIVLIFTAILVLCFLLRIFWFANQMLFILVATIDCCLSLVPFMWITCEPKFKSWWKFYLEQEIIHGEQYNFLEMAGLPTRFTIKEISTATENFQASVGEGASGAVFKGTLADGSTIAVKRIKWQSSGETEFKTEITIIASLQHVNLVRLLGYCLSPKGNHCLVYPFFENGSLDAWLFKDVQRRCRLTWPLRYLIAIDVAKALAYLHHQCHHRILHLDIKPANILLDDNFRALVSDFGISKLIGRDESSVMTRARGTVILINKHSIVLF